MNSEGPFMYPVTADNYRSAPGMQTPPGMQTAPGMQTPPGMQPANAMPVSPGMVYNADMNGNKDKNGVMYQNVPYIPYNVGFAFDYSFNRIMAITKASCMAIIRTL